MHLPSEDRLRRKSQQGTTEQGMSTCELSEMGKWRQPEPFSDASVPASGAGNDERKREKGGELGWGDISVGGRQREGVKQENSVTRNDSLKAPSGNPYLEQYEPCMSVCVTLGAGWRGKAGRTWLCSWAFS